MKPVMFDECTTVFAKHQAPYCPLPGHINQLDGRGKATFCWGLDWKDRLRVLFTGRVWQQVLTFNQSLQPQLLSTTKPHMSQVAAVAKREA